MNKKAEIALWAMAAAMLIAVVITAWVTVPKMEPVTVKTPVTAAETTAAPTSVTVSGPIDLNTATADELMTVPGIGPKTAADIIAYRESHGGFDSVDELDNVSGIGPASVEKWRSYFVVN